jgi:hypothetical protein
LASAAERRTGVRAGTEHVMIPRDYVTANMKHVRFHSGREIAWRKRQESKEEEYE